MGIMPASKRKSTPKNNSHKQQNTKKSNNVEIADHTVLSERLRKTLHYGYSSKKIRTASFLETELAVDYFRDSVPCNLGQVDHMYAASVTRRAGVSPCSMMLGMLYIERLKHKNPDYLQKMTSSELFLISMMLASKYQYDEGVDEEVFNDEWAESAHISQDDLNELERKFLTAIDWQLFVSEADFARVLTSIEQRIALCQGVDRGWFSYTDLNILDHDYETLTNTLSAFANVVWMCCVAYTTGALCLVASVSALTSLTSPPTSPLTCLTSHDQYNRLPTKCNVDSTTVPASRNESDFGPEQFLNDTDEAGFDAAEMNSSQFGSPEQLSYQTNGHRNWNAPGLSLANPITLQTHEDLGHGDRSASYSGHESGNSFSKQNRNELNDNQLWTSNEHENGDGHGKLGRDREKGWTSTLVHVTLSMFHTSGLAYTNSCLREAKHTQSPQLPHYCLTQLRI